MRRLFLVVGIIYILIYAFEGVVRYGLAEAGASNAIFIRDAMLILACMALFAVQACRLRVHPAFFVLAFIIACHGALAYENLHTSDPVIYGAKLLEGELFGFLAGAMFAVPDKRVTRILGLVLFVSLVGVMLDKWFMTFPWEGMSTHVGGLKVAVATDWETGSGMTKRAAGFTRVSISSAILIPVLTLVLLPKVRSWLLRTAMLLAAIVAVFFTTQKGALIALVPVSAVFFLPRSWRFTLLGVLCAGFAVLDILLPIVTSGMVVSDHGGMFSLATFGMRIMLTWPDAWQWILQHQIFPLGVGLGGLGGAMRLYAPEYMNPADNMFLFIYAWFGVLGFVYMGWPIVNMWRTPRNARPEMIGAAAMLTFLMGYGAVLSLLEDPFAALFAGAACGAMWQARQRATGGVWADTFAPKVHDPYGGTADPALPAAMPTRRTA